MSASEYKAERELRGTQEEVARALGVSRITIARREAGLPGYPITAEAEIAIKNLKMPVKNQPRKTRWIKSPWSYKEISGKRIYATFTTASGMLFEGVGTLAVRQNPEGLQAVRAVFTHRVGFRMTDYIYYLSSRQLSNVRLVDCEEFEFKYVGQLEPDNDPNA